MPKWILRTMLLLVTTFIAVVVAIVGLAEVANYPDRLYTIGWKYLALLVFLALVVWKLVARWRHKSSVVWERLVSGGFGLALFGLGFYGLLFDSADWMISIWPAGIGVFLLSIAVVPPREP